MYVICFSGEFPRPELRQHARISGACLDAALGLLPQLTIKGTRHPTKDGTCIRDYIHVVDLVRAHMVAMEATYSQSAGSLQCWDGERGIRSGICPSLQEGHRGGH